MGTIMNRQLPGMLLTAFAFCITISCSDKSATDPTGLALNDSTAAESRIASASVSLAQSSLQVGQTTQATAVLLDRYNNQLSLPVVWSTSDTSLATVSGSGLVTARSPGSVSIIATRGYKSGSATLTVVPSTVSVASVTVSLPASSLSVGQTERATATLRDSSNNVVTGPPVVWSSSNASAATLTDSGMVTALAAGSTMISASAGGKTGSAPLAVTTTSPVPVASVTVSPASATLQIGATVQLQVSAYDANNNVLTGRVVTSSSANPAIASVNSLGLVTGVSAGTTQITVTSEGKSAVATITVTASAPTNPGTVTDLQASVTGSTSVTLSFTQVTDGAGQPAKYDVRFAVAPISWGSATSIANGTCATPLAGTAIGSKLSCTVLGLTAGTNYNFQLIAFRGTMNQGAIYGSLSNIASATTTGSVAPPPAPVASVTVSPSSASLQVGATQQLSAVTRDANNNVLTGRVITWSSANTSIAGVSASGLVTALVVGSVQVKATSEGVTGTSTITVTTTVPPPPTGTAEPSGMTTITERPFSAISEDGWSIVAASGSVNNFSIVQDATAPKSPSGVGQILYPAGFAAGGEPVNVYKVLSPQYRTLYVGVWLKMSSNFQGNPTLVNKMIHLFTGGSNHVVPTIWGSGNGMLQAGVLLQGIVTDGKGQSASNLYPNLGPTGEIVRGRWHHLEYVFVGNTSGTANASAEWWLDGVKVGSYTNMQYVSGSSVWEQLAWAPTWGGVTGTVTSAMTESFDHIRVSGK